MDHILHLAQILASFAFVLGILVSIHEMGHYLAARACHITVEAFSLGFGPSLKTWVDKRGTEWKISVLPLGGYVKMYGMSPDARADAAAAGEEFRPLEAYSEKPVWQRAIVAAAGPVANFALAVVLFGLVPGFNAGYGAAVVAILGLLFITAALLRLLPIWRSHRIRLFDLSFLLGLLAVFVIQLIAGVGLAQHSGDGGDLQTVCVLVIVCFLIGIERAWELVGGPDIGLGRELFGWVHTRRQAERDSADQDR